MYWYDGTNWKYAQQKTSIGQPPLFDLFDENEVSYSDTSVYDSSTFQGNKVFSYKIGTGPVDSNLNFPLTYKNINNVGDIVFEFNLLNESFNYKVETQVDSKNTDVAYLRQIEDLSTYSYANGWTKTLVTNIQPIVRIFKNSGLVILAIIVVVVVVAVVATRQFQQQFNLGFPYLPWTVSKTSLKLLDSRPRHFSC